MRISDWSSDVCSSDLLRLLLVLTVVDIRAVGPAVWNGWKRQLLSDLYEAAEEVLRLGHQQTGRSVRIEVKQRNLAGELGWSATAFQAYRKRFVDAYWIAGTPDVLLRTAPLVAEAEPAETGRATGRARG